MHTSRDLDARTIFVPPTHAGSMQYFALIMIGLIKVFFLAHLSRRFIGELIVYLWSGVHRPSASYVVHNAQKSSSQKPLGRSKPNFMWSLLG